MEKLESFNAQCFLETIHAVYSQAHEIIVHTYDSFTNARFPVTVNLSPDRHRRAFTHKPYEFFILPNELIEFYVS